MQQNPHLSNEQKAVLFDKATETTGDRYCINSLSLDFQQHKDTE